ncbi:MAG: NAD(P)-dependent oxidoreductase [Deltaproteobacteria bacterium]|nr:NAD(P)-dependent oxidoreductase [Deltaproteobacteria bacterium]
MKVAVTGSAGRLGRYVTELLSRQGYTVVPLDLAGNDGSKPEEPTCPNAVDLTDPEAVQRAFAGAEAVIHLARERFPYTEQGLFDPATGTWTTPDVAGDSLRFQRNVAMTYNVLAAGASLGIRRFVIGSSLAVYGLYYPLRPALPDYLPIDEKHPRRPQDPYGLSKLAGEALCDGFAQGSGARIASLRFAGIADERVYQRLRKRREDPMSRGVGSFWSYVDVRDAAAACRLALEADFESHEAFNICAPTTYLIMPTQALLERHLPGVRTVAFQADANYCGYASDKARKSLGFSPRHGPDG